MNLRPILFLLALSLFLAACNLPQENPAPADEATSTPEASPLGSEGNPIALAMPPGAKSDAAASAEALAGQLSSLTGLTIVARPVESYTDLVAALGDGTVHIAWLPPLAYLLAHENGHADAALGALVAGRDRTAAQFLVNAARTAGEAGFKVYFEPSSGANAAQVSLALAQFAGKRPCWPDAYSAVGYVLPLQLLAANHGTPKSGAFLQGDATVVNTLYRDTTGSLCDFGVTAVDARADVISDLPDVMDKVLVVWRAEPIVPNDALAYAAGLSDEDRIHITAAFLALAGSEEGMSNLRAAYGVDGLKWIDDSFFNELRAALQLTGVDLPVFIH
jgi:phosphonate transport system substrate-binding protein